MTTTSEARITSSARQPTGQGPAGVLGRGLGVGGGGVRGGLVPANEGGGAAAAGGRGLGGGRGAVRAGLRAGGDHVAARATADGGRARVRGRRGHLVLGRAAP